MYVFIFYEGVEVFVLVVFVVFFLFVVGVVGYVVFCVGGVGVFYENVYVDVFLVLLG